MNMIHWKNKRLGGESSEPETTTSLRNELHRLVESVWREPFRWAGESFGSAKQWRPSVEMTESEEAVTIKAELAGVDPKDIDVTVTGQQLTISGQRRDTSETDQGGAHITERSYGSFRRAITLPDGVDTAQIEASAKDGVLTVRVNKTPAAKPQRIDVKTR